MHELIEKDLAPSKIRTLRERVLPLAETLVSHAKANGRLRADVTVSDLALVQHMLAAAGEATFAAGETAWQRDLAALHGARPSQD